VTGVTSTSAGSGTVPARRLTPEVREALASDRVPALAAASCGTAYAAITALAGGDPRLEAAHGFAPETAPPVAALCDQVVRDRRLVVTGDGGATAVGMFAGAPVLTSRGDLLGVLWVADDSPRRSPEAFPEHLLLALADQVALGSELRALRQERERALGMVGAVVFYATEDGVVTTVSSSWTDLTGHPADSTVGRRIVDFLPADAAEPVTAVLAAAGRDSVRRLDCTVLTAEGVGIPVDLAATRFPRGGDEEPDGLYVVLTDLRERHRRDLEARHDQKLESLGRLSAGIAHEINTPIQFVGDNTRFLASAYQEMLDLLLTYRACMDSSSGEVSWEERMKRAADAEQEADIDYLASEVPVAVQQSMEGIERVASLVRAMKAFSYKDSRDRSYADLNEALTTTLTVARNEVKYVADVALDLGELPQVLCHVGDLNQVFLNLLVNAADALQENGERGEIRITTRTEGAMAVISVADNGPGIPADLQRMIFEPFFTTKEIGKGTGQGLALARAVVIDKHGGTIEVRSAPGEGTEFVLRLPVDGKRPDAA
jgi:signal transduction histidine kinase